MRRGQRLARILRRLNEGADPAVERREAREFLASVSAADLCRAEQELMDAGTRPEELRHLCAIHIEVVGERSGGLRSELGADHVLRWLLDEHQAIMALLDELAVTNRDIRPMDRCDRRRREFRRLRQTAEELLAAEAHHQREEEVLFPELERLGLAAPARIVQTEHEELRERNRELLELVERAKEMDLREFKRQLDTTATLIVLTLREHILKEDNILYPTALEVINDEQVWEKMRAEAYRIGRRRSTAHP